MLTGYLKTTARATLRQTRQGKYALFGRRIFEINDTVEYILSLCDGTRTQEQIAGELFAHYGGDQQAVESKLAGFVSGMLKQGVLVTTETASPSEPIYRPIKPASIILELTHACNERCAYCVTRAGKSLHNELTFAEFDRLVDEIIALRINPVNLTGGDPLLRKDLLLHMARRISQAGLTPKLLTNAVLITEKVAQELHEAGIRKAQVSIDGEADAHDQVRGLTGAFERARSGITALRGVGIEVTIATTVIGDNFSVEALDKLSTLVHSLGDKVKIAPVIPEGRGQDCSHLLSPDQRFQFLEYMHRTPDGSLHADVFPRERCSIGTTPLVQSNGDVFPCMLTRFEELKIGNIRQNSLQQIWDESEKLKELLSWKIEDIQGCRTCWNKLFCGGGCRGVAFGQHGTIYKNDPSVCVAQRRFAKELLCRGTPQTRQALEKLIPEGIPEVSYDHQ